MFSFASIGKECHSRKFSQRYSKIAEMTNLFATTQLNLDYNKIYYIANNKNASHIRFIESKVTYNSLN